MNTTCIKQVASYDCGIACACMLLEQQVSLSELLAQIPHDGSTNGVWTIEIAYLVSKYHKNVHLFSTILGARPSHSNLSFYANEDQNFARINQLFADAKEHQITTKECSLSMQEFATLVGNSLSGVMICTNAHCLQCTTCGGGCNSKKVDTFQGHFVLVTKCDQGLVYYNDPNPIACSNGCCMEQDAFEKARTFDGTDEDTLFL